MMQGLACRRLAFVFSGDKTAGYPAGLATSSTRLAGSGGEDPQHNAASLTRVETPQPRQQLADPAAEASSLLERVQVGRGRAWVGPQQGRCLSAPPAPAALPARLPFPQDVLRPASTRGHAYRWAEGSARAALREQQASCSGVPGVESM